MPDTNDAVVVTEAEYCPSCTCNACQRESEDRAIARALAEDAEARCWSCSCGWIGCYTAADIVYMGGEPSECNRCYRERLSECRPPSRVARLSTQSSMQARIEELEAENERLTKAVGSGILGQLLNDEEANEFVKFIKFLRSSPEARATLSNTLGGQSNE